MEKPVIIVTGLEGSGKSTLAEKLGKKYGLKVVFASGILRALRKRKFADIRIYEVGKGKGWWESEEGMKFQEQRLDDVQLDIELDQHLLEIIEEGNVVLDSRTMPWLSKKGYKIWLEASLETRAKRISERDRLPVKKVSEIIAKRAEENRVLYRELYHFELGTDFTPFDLVLDTNPLTEDQTFEKVCRLLDTTYLKKG